MKGNEKLLRSSNDWGRLWGVCAGVSVGITAGMEKKMAARHERQVR